MPDIRIISATKQTRTDFSTHTWLGQSLARLESMGIKIDRQIEDSNNNNDGLSKIYNRRLEPFDDDIPTVLVHDDVSIQDVFIIEKLQLALETFQIVGIAGSKLARNNFPAAWWWSRDSHSGAVAHAERAKPRDYLNGKLILYGSSPSEASCLDGQFLAFRPSTFHKSELQFDEDFKFHHYDLSFCIRAMRKGLRLGTWPIWLVHGSPGVNTSNPEARRAWESSVEKFNEKYNT
jgi:GT2 family glycosyltransferase